jgi:hypothetical protein
MPRLDISQLPDESRIWVFGISPSLDAQKSSRVLETVDRFLDSWAAHGQPIVSARALLHGTFLVIAVDRQSETSGCSIDRMFGLLQHLERELGVAILDANRIFYREPSGAVSAMTRGEFAERGVSETVVFDILVERIGNIRTGAWEKSARASWHRALLEKTG